MTDATPLPRFGAALLALATLASPLAAQRSWKELDRRLDSLPLGRSFWGIAVEDERGRLLYGRNADRLFIPASSTKLLVSAAAAVLLPPDLTVRTGVHATAPLQDGVLRGDLVLVGRGDPTFGRRCYAVDTLAPGACDGDPMLRMRQLAKALRLAGLRRVHGDLVGDGSLFTGPLTHPSWEQYDLNWWYAAPVGALGFNDNSLDLTVAPGEEAGAPPRLAFAPDFGDVILENRGVTGTTREEATLDFTREPGTMRLRAEGVVPAGAAPATEYFAVPDPNLFAAQALRAALAAEGIAVTGATRSTTDPGLYRAARDRAPLAELESRPVRDWIFPVLNTSQNWFAEMLLFQLGAQVKGEASWDAGLAVIRGFLRDSVGLDSTAFAQRDASGLSSQNLVTPRAFTALLRYMRAHPRYAVFAAGLPQAGATGSLRRRYAGTPLEGRVRAKTGSIARTNTLAGYLELEGGRVLTFSVQANHHVLGGRAMIQQIDSVVVAIARLAGRR